MVLSSCTSLFACLLDYEMLPRHFVGGGALFGTCDIKDGIHPDPAKSEKVKHYTTPTDVTNMHPFHGLASYHRRFVPNFA